MNLKKGAALVLASIIMISACGCTDMSSDNTSKDTRSKISSEKSLVSATSSSEETVSSETETTSSETTSSETSSSESNDDTMTIGNSELGYLEIPSDFYVFEDIDGNDSLQYSDKIASTIFTMNTIDVDNLDDASLVLVNMMYSEGGEDITRAEVTVAGKYPAKQVYAYWPKEDKYLVGDVFEVDGKIIYISAEFMTKDSDMVKCLDTYHYDSEEEKSLFSSSENTSSASAETISSESKTTSSETSSAAKTGDTQTIGNSECGYLDIPSDFYVFEDIDGNDSIQYSDKIASTIFTMNTIDVDNLDDASLVLVNMMYSEGGEDITRAEVTVAGKYPAKQVYAYWPKEDKYLVGDVFEVDGKIIYISAEFMTKDSDMVKCLDTYHYDSEEEKSLFSSSENTSSASAETISSESKTTSSETSSAAKTGDTQTIGNSECGYLDIPSDFYVFEDIDGNDSIQYSDKIASTIFTMNTIDVDNLDDASLVLVNMMDAEGGEQITRADVTVAGKYQAKQVYAYWPKEDKYLVGDVFEVLGKIIYISAEFKSEDSDMVDYLDTYHYVYQSDFTFSIPEINLQ